MGIYVSKMEKSIYLNLVVRKSNLLVGLLRGFFP